MSIVKEAMVCNLQLGMWLGYRLDREASRTITEQSNAAQDAARVNKHLVPKETLKPVQQAATAIRTHFYLKTLPWKDNGDRLLTRAMYMSFIEEHEKLVGGFEDAVETFLKIDYPQARDRAEFRMGALFDPNDYPGTTMLRRKFYVNLDIDAVTEAGDFRVTMEQHQLDAVRVSMERAMQARLGRAMQDVWARLGETLGHFADKMGSDAIFRDSTVRNLEEIVDMLPGLNVLNDPELERIRQDIRASLIGYDPKDLRKDSGARSAAAQEAQRIMADMAGFMNAMKEAA